MAACFALFASAARPDDAPAPETLLPRTFLGTFRWQGEPILQKVAIKFTAVRRREDRKLEAQGCGRYDVLGRVTDIGIRMVLDPAGLNLEIWEFDPSTKAFETDGSHVGKASIDLSSIDAVWVSRATQRAGILHLRAGGDISCAPETS